MNRIVPNWIINKTIFGLFCTLIIGAVQIVVATIYQLHSVMVAHGWVPK
jgi:hypothetical protein